MTCVSVSRGFRGGRKNDEGEGEGVEREREGGGGFKREREAGEIRENE